MESMLKDWVESEEGFIRKDTPIHRLQSCDKFYSWGVKEYSVFKDMVDVISPSFFQNQVYGEFVANEVHSDIGLRRTNRNGDVFEYRPEDSRMARPRRDMLPDEVIFAPLINPLTPDQIAERDRRRERSGPHEARVREIEREEYARFLRMINRPPLYESRPAPGYFFGVDTGGSSDNASYHVYGTGGNIAEEDNQRYNSADVPYSVDPRSI